MQEINIDPYLIRYSRTSRSAHDEVEQHYRSRPRTILPAPVSRWDTWGSCIVLAGAVAFFVYMGFFYR